MSGSLRIAVDAANLVRDRRGMGRLARAVLREAAADPELHLSLLAASRRDRAALRAEFSSSDERIVVEDTSRARRPGRFDVVWYPFNGVRFTAASPSVVLIHDVFAFTEPHPEWIARRKEQGPIARAAREATTIATTTEWNRGEIARELAVAASRIEVVRPEPDPFFFPASDTSLPSESGDASEGASRFVLAVGGGEERKNLAMLVDACANALRAPAERLVIVGDASADALRLAAQRGPAVARVTADDTLLRTLYRSAALVAVPSLAEGFGLVAVEAMACGAPVIAADGSGLREATRGAAMLVPPSDSRRWSEAIRSVLDDDRLRSELAGRARAAFAGSDRTAHARRTLAVLRHTAGATATRS